MASPLLLFPSSALSKREGWFLPLFFLPGHGSSEGFPVTVSLNWPFSWYEPSSPPFSVLVISDEALFPPPFVSLGVVKMAILGVKVGILNSFSPPFPLSGLNVPFPFSYISLGKVERDLLLSPPPLSVVTIPSFPSLFFSLPPPLKTIVR